jgi:hypothetical protein
VRSAGFIVQVESDPITRYEVHDSFTSLSFTRLFIDKTRSVHDDP